MKKVSIIVPLYKSESFMHKLLESILAQTYSNLEIILVDDGSPDHSGKIADEYALRDSRFIVIHKRNGGTCDARNAGLANATGDYLMFADGDDWLEPDCVEYLVELLEKNSAEMSMTDAIFTTRDRMQNSKDMITVMDNKDAVAAIINTFLIPVGPWNKLYLMKNIKKNNLTFSVPWFGEGLYFSTMAAMYSEKIAVGHRKVYNYRLNNPNSGCTVREVQNAINSLNNILYIKDRLELSSKDISDALSWHIWTNNFNIIVYVIGAKQKKEYQKEYVTSRNELRQLLPKVWRHNKLPVKSKLRITLTTCFPYLMAKRELRHAKKALDKDKFE